LEENCIADRAKVIQKRETPASDAKESDLIVHAFKKNFVTPFHTSLAYRAMLKETEVGSLERAQGIHEFFEESNLPDTSHLSMYV
jgi:hypothetical protein